MHRPENKQVLIGIGAAFAAAILIASVVDHQPSASTASHSRDLTSPTASAEPWTPASPTATATPTAAPAAEQTGVPAAAPPPAGSGTALALLGTLAVKGRAPMTGYSRDQFGQAWADVDHNGCDTRNDILRRDLVRLQIKPGTNGCLVLSGDADPDPYSGTLIHFVRGGADEIDIDHVVALGDAWQKGAQQLSAAYRLDLANDPLNLLAVDSSLNRQKGDGDAATWLPPDKGYRCSYVARQVAVKAKYHLWVTAAEHDAIARVLATCPSQPVPDGGLPVTVAASAAAPVQTTAPPAAAPPPPAPPPPAGSTTEVYYANCSAARAAGAAPIYRGQPGYRAALDRDGDGVACES